MATFYHRLPLLEPGLCGIGVAVDRDVVVLDSGSLLNSYTGEAHVRWPAPLASDVPLAWRPELPNPVPDEDQSGWGYPITVQSYWGVEGKVGTLELALFVDESDKPVECHLVSPTSTKQKRIKPADAYCLIPKERLEPNTRYRVEATVVERGTSFKWTFKTGRNTY